MDLVKDGCAVISGMTVPGETELRGCLLPARKSLIDCTRVWVFAVPACRGDSRRAGAGGSPQLLCSGSTLARSAQTWTQRLTQAWTQAAVLHHPRIMERMRGQWVIAHNSHLSLNIPSTCQSRAGAVQTHTLSEKLPTIWEQVEKCKRELDKV